MSGKGGPATPEREPRPGQTPSADARSADARSGHDEAAERRPASGGVAPAAEPLHGRRAASPRRKLADALVLAGYAVVCAVISLLLLLVGFSITPSSYPPGPQLAAARPYLGLARLLSDAFPLVLLGALLGGLALRLGGASVRQASMVLWTVHGAWWLALVGTYVAGAIAGAFRGPFIAR